MFYEGFFNFLNFILSPDDQPKKYILAVGVLLLINVLVAVIDWKWGRGIAFTALALLAAAYYVYLSVVMLQGMRQNLELELAEPQSWASFGVNIGIAFWYILELPVLLGLGIGAVILSALSRQRGWIIAAAVAGALTLLSPLLFMWTIPVPQAGTDYSNPLYTYARDVRLVQTHLVIVIALFAIQLLYLAYGVRRIWRSRGLGSQRRSRAAASLPSVQS